jgi:hypothetical protein
VIHPTLRPGVEAMLAAAGVWLASEEGNESAGVTRAPGPSAPSHA